MSTFDAKGLTANAFSKVRGYNISRNPARKLRVTLIFKRVMLRLMATISLLVKQANNLSHAICNFFLNDTIRHIKCPPPHGKRSASLRLRVYYIKHCFQLIHHWPFCSSHHQISTLKLWTYPLWSKINVASENKTWNLLANFNLLPNCLSHRWKRILNKQFTAIKSNNIGKLQQWYFWKVTFY